MRSAGTALRALCGALAASALVASTFVADLGVARADPVPIRVGWVLVPAELAPLMFAKPGLAPHDGKNYVGKPIRFQGTSLMIQALASGDIDIGLMAFSSFALAIQNAHMNDLRVIADSFQDGVPGYHSNEFMVLKESGIKSVDDLKGKVLGSNTIGSAVDIAMRAMIERHGLADKKNVTIVEAPLSQMTAMLAEHKVDLVPSVLPFYTDPKLHAIARPLFSQKDAIGQTQMIIEVARTGFIQKDHAALVDFLEDQIHATRFFTDPKNHEAAVAIASAYTKIPPERFDSWLFTKKDYYHDPNALPNLKALQANMDVQYKLGFLKERIEVAKYADLEPVETAAKRLK
ncbi:MAG TPA: ABC transporter substrate-binding protein [Alphaproteobacteria bacterium]|nr:ABC transporter substrate-binding protein [Alphaproteobacteria bacterium]